MGRIVHVRAARGEHAKCQPALVVQVWEDEPKAYVNLQVFRDGSNDSRYDGLGYALDNSYNALTGDVATRWATSVYEGQGPYEFHDPRTCVH